VTFLFTDVEGSTRLLQELGRERYGQALDDHQRLLREVCGPAGAREVDTQGDAFFFVFAKARDAVGAAAESQRALAAHAWPGQTSLRVRMGLHTGEALQANGRYVGLSVHRAARVCAVAAGGQVLVSEATASVLEDEELGELAVKPVGRFTLKDFDRPVELHQLDVPGLPTTFAPPKPKPEAPRGEGRRPSKRLVIGAALLAAVLGAAVLAWLVASGGDGAQALSSVEANSVGAIDPSRNEIVGQVRVGTQPTQLAIGNDAVWVSNAADGTVSRVKPEALELDRNVPVGSERAGLATLGDRLWVANYAVVQPEEPDVRAARRRRTDLTRVDGSNYAVSPTVVPDRGTLDWFLAPGAAPVAASPGAIWVGTANGLAEVDPERGTVKRRYPLAGRPELLAFGEGGIWVLRRGFSLTGDARLQRVDRRSGVASDELVVSGDAADMAAGLDAVWVVVRERNSVLRVDPATNTVVDTIDVGDGPIGVAVGDGAVWVANELSATVSRIDPQKNEVVETIPLGNRPAGIAVGHGRVWVTVY
jgi:YVTN family beta-propeller protein